ncbi:g220 [Coccomyxa viridis]|uniref:glycerophosphodiester phosphodiesterase n=1 Tax=Coccomyxa viridis TaxID=1274662 RepID=A0ABP1FLR9_9CHLO
MSHRAGGNEAPENTLAALRHAESAGSRVMQMDILPTADGTPVVFHDVNMRRATGLDEDVRKVPTSKLPPYRDVLEPLLPLDGAKPIHTRDFKDGQRIPTLSELLEAADEDTFLQLEFWDENVDLIRRSAAIIRKAGRQHRVIVGAPQNAKIWQMCGQEMPEASRILPDSEVYKIYFLWLTGTISWWQPPEGTVFNIPLFTGWEQALAKKIPMSWWKRVTFQALIRFNKWLYPRPELFKWLNEHGVPVLVYILNRPEDWDIALKLEGITAIMTDSPSALVEYLADHS